MGLKERVILLQADKVQVEKTIPSTEISFCKGGKKKYGAFMDGKASYATGVEICANMEPWKVR